MYPAHPEKSRLYYGRGYFYIRADTPQEVRERIEKDLSEYLTEKKRRENEGDFTPFSFRPQAKVWYNLNKLRWALKWRFCPNHAPERVIRNAGL